MPDPASKSSGEQRTLALSDPSFLTTTALLREIAILKEQFRSELAGEIKVIEARLAAIDKATVVFETNLTRVPTETQKAVGHLQELTEEKFCKIATHLEGMAKLKAEQFHAVQQQFGDRDIRILQQAESGQKAVDAALQAAKEAVAKSEVAQMKAIEQLGAVLQTSRAAVDGQIADVKDRITRIEAIAIGQAGQRGEQHTSSSLVISLGALLLTLVGLAIALFTRG
jgi:phage shock protein A